jgi:hypothetical protein
MGEWIAPASSPQGICQLSGPDHKGPWRPTPFRTPSGARRDGKTHHLIKAWSVWGSARIHAGGCRIAAHAQSADRHSGLHLAASGPVSHKPRLRGCAMRPAAARFAMPPDGQAVDRTASGPDAVLIAPVVDEQSIGSLAVALEAEQHLVVLRKRDQEPIIIPTGAALVGDDACASIFVRCTNCRTDPRPASKATPATRCHILPSGQPGVPHG